jgi:PhnB protein
MAFHPYLYFNGNCREAFTRYQEIFGGELVIMDWTDAPPDSGIPDDKRHLVMHAALVGGDELIMGSDVFSVEVSTPDAMVVHYSTTDVDRAKTIFAELSEGGDVSTPGGEMFWTPFYGMVTDRFGMPWQVSVEQAAPED